MVFCLDCVNRGIVDRIRWRVKIRTNPARIIKGSLSPAFRKPWWVRCPSAPGQVDTVEVGRLVHKTLRARWDNARHPSEATSDTRATFLPATAHGQAATLLHAPR